MEQKCTKIAAWVLAIAPEKVRSKPAAVTSLAELCCPPPSQPWPHHHRWFITAAFVTKNLLITQEDLLHLILSPCFCLSNPSSQLPCHGLLTQVTHSKPMIPLASANSSIILLIYTTMKGINKTLPQHTELNVSALIPQSVSTHSLQPPLYTLILPLLHFDQLPILTPILASLHSLTLPQTMLFPSHTWIPPDSPPSLSFNPCRPKWSPLLAQCPLLLVTPPPRSLLTFLLPSLVTFPWKVSQILPLSQPTPHFVCNHPSHRNLGYLSMVQICSNGNVIHQNLCLSLLSLRILFL